MTIPGVSAVLNMVEKHKWVNHAIGTGVIVGVEGYTMRGRVQSGESVLSAGAKSAFNIAGSMLVNQWAWVGLTMGLPLIAGAGQMVTHAVHSHNNHVRMMRTPFSHRFEHTDVTAQAQQMGMSGLQQGLGYTQMGAEASMMASRYGRR
jgi:hypothetical protein